MHVLSRSAGALQCSPYWEEHYSMAQLFQDSLALDGVVVWPVTSNLLQWATRSAA